MDKIKLEELVPTAAQFRLMQTGETYELRPFNLADEMWLTNTFGDELQKVFSEFRTFEICRIVYHQLTPSDQEKFSKRKIKIMNEEGDSVEHEIGGFKLLAHLVQGWPEKKMILDSLLATIGISRPLLKRLTDDEEAQKKSAQESRLTGEPSLTSSEPNTDGHLSSASA